ncbi:MAG: type II toxin-antitoxin system VapC family toxin [Myxococcaceae bacterium]|nr:type II toxin-antitoxin system VapC family toxin [Myxococcaceae bacterium]
MIDPTRLPKRAAIDSTILTRTRDDATGPDAALCREFVESMITSGKVVIAPAVCVMEFMRKAPHEPPPRVEGFEVAAFDDQAAYEVAGRFPPEVFKERPGTGAQNWLKFDTLVIATAVRHRAECLVTLDGDQKKLAERVGLQVRHPRDFEDPQGSLPLDD